MKSIVTLSFIFVALVTAGCQREAPEEGRTQVAEETPVAPVMMPPVEVTNSDFVEPPEAPQPSSPMPAGGEASALPEAANPAAPLPDRQRADATPPTSPSASEGKRLYEEYGCGTCHGANGDGRRMGLRSFSERAVQQKPDAELMRIIIEGGGPQSAGAHKSRNLGAEQAHAVVAWIRTLG
ncbi:MAG: cytochrome c [Thermoanaerobaculia bacterium]